MQRFDSECKTTWKIIRHNQKGNEKESQLESNQYSVQFQYVATKPLLFLQKCREIMQLEQQVDKWDGGN